MFRWIVTRALLALLLFVGLGSLGSSPAGAAAILSLSAPESAMPGQSVDVLVFLDTDSMNLEAYAYTITFSQTVTVNGVDLNTITPMMRLVPPSPGTFPAAGTSTISGISQACIPIPCSPNVAPSSNLLLDTLGITIPADAVVGTILDVAVAFSQGEGFRFEQTGSTAPLNTPTQPISIVPEPGTAGLLALGILGLAAPGPRRRARARHSTPLRPRARPSPRAHSSSNRTWEWLEEVDGLCRALYGDSQRGTGPSSDHLGRVST